MKLLMCWRGEPEPRPHNSQFIVPVLTCAAGAPARPIVWRGTLEPCTCSRPVPGARRTGEKIGLVIEELGLNYDLGAV
jgi:hypothetical protein